MQEEYLSSFLFHRNSFQFSCVANSVEMFCRSDNLVIDCAQLYIYIFCTSTLFSIFVILQSPPDIYRYLKTDILHK